MGKKVYKCDVRECEKLFSSKFSLKRHNLRHINSKKHVCSHCQKAFSLPQYLEEHEYTHTGAKPFVCGINNCAETFRQRGKLSIHRKNAHQNRMNDDAGPMGVMNGLSGAPTHLNNRFIQRLEQIEEEEKFQFDHHHHSQLSMPSPISGANGVPGVVNGNFDNQQLLAQNNFSKQQLINQQNKHQQIQIQNRQPSQQMSVPSSLQHQQSQSSQQLQHQQQQIPPSSQATISTANSINHQIKTQNSFNQMNHSIIDRGDEHQYQITDQQLKASTLQQQWSDNAKIESLDQLSSRQSSQQQQQQKQQQKYINEYTQVLQTQAALSQYIQQSDNMFQSNVNQVPPQSSSSMYDINSQVLSLQQQNQMLGGNPNNPSNKQQQMNNMSSGQSGTTPINTNNFMPPQQLKMNEIQNLPTFANHQATIDMQRNQNQQQQLVQPNTLQQRQEQSKQQYNANNNNSTSQNEGKVQPQQQQQFANQGSIQPSQIQQAFGVGLPFDSASSQQMIDGSHQQIQAQQLLQSQQVAMVDKQQTNLNSCAASSQKAQFMAFQQN